MNRTGVVSIIRHSDSGIFHCFIIRTFFRSIQLVDTVYWEWLLLTGHEGQLNYDLDGSKSRSIEKPYTEILCIPNDSALPVWP